MGIYGESFENHKFCQSCCRWYHSTQNGLTKKMRPITYPATYETPSNNQLFHPRPNCSKFNWFRFAIPAEATRGFEASRLRGFEAARLRDFVAWILESLIPAGAHSHTKMKHVAKIMSDTWKCHHNGVGCIKIAVTTLSDTSSKLSKEATSSNNTQICEAFWGAA